MLCNIQNLILKLRQIPKLIYEIPRTFVKTLTKLTPCSEPSHTDCVLHAVSDYKKRCSEASAGVS